VRDAMVSLGAHGDAAFFAAVHTEDAGRVFLQPGLHSSAPRPTVKAFLEPCFNDSVLGMVRGAETSSGGLIRAARPGAIALWLLEMRLHSCLGRLGRRPCRLLGGGRSRGRTRRGGCRRAGTGCLDWGRARLGWVGVASVNHVWFLQVE
jgi:hypothetical protein